MKPRTKFEKTVAASNERLAAISSKAVDWAIRNVVKHISFRTSGHILEGEAEGNDTILFGIVIGLMEDEYGYISLNELSEVELDLTKQGYGKLQVRQQQDFQPTPLKKLQDNRLQRFLARFED